MTQTTTTSLFKNCPFNCRNYSIVSGQNCPDRLQHHFPVVWSALHQACILSGGRALNPLHFGSEGCSCKLFFSTAPRRLGNLRRRDSALEWHGVGCPSCNNCNWPLPAYGLGYCVVFIGVQYKTAHKFCWCASPTFHDTASRWCQSQRINR